MSKTLAIFFVVICNPHFVFSAELKDRINDILSRYLYPEAYLITTKDFQNYQIISLYAKSPADDSYYEAVSFLLKGDQIIAKIKGVPVKTTDKYVYFYDRYNFYRLSLDTLDIKKEKRLYADFFKRIHRENLIIVDSTSIKIKRKTLIFDDGKSLSLDIPENKNLYVLNFHYCEGNLLGIVPLENKTFYYLIDIKEKKVLKKKIFPNNDMFGFFACIDNKLLVYKQGLKFLDLEEGFSDLPYFQIVPYKKVLLKKTSVNIPEDHEVFFEKQFFYTRSLQNTGYSPVFEISIYQYNIGKPITSFNLHTKFTNIYTYTSGKNLFIDIPQTSNRCIYSFSTTEKNLNKLICYKPEDFNKYMLYKQQTVNVIPEREGKGFFVVIEPGKYCVKYSVLGSGNCTKWKNFEGYIIFIDQKKDVLWKKKLDKKSNIVGEYPEKIIYINKDKHLTVIYPDGTEKNLFKFTDKVYLNTKQNHSLIFKTDNNIAYIFNIESEKVTQIPQNCRKDRYIFICDNKDNNKKALVDIYTGKTIFLNTEGILPICFLKGYILVQAPVYKTKKLYILVFDLEKQKAIDVLSINLYDEYLCKYDKFIHIKDKTFISFYEIGK